MLSGLVILLLLLLDDDSRLLRLHDSRSRLLHDNRRGLLLRRIDGPLVARRDERDPYTRPENATDNGGNRDGDDADVFLPNGPGLLRWLDHDGGRLHHLRLLLVYHLAHGLHGLLLLIHHLPHGLHWLLHGVDDRHGRGLNDLRLRLHDGSHGRLLCHGGGLGARDVARGHHLALVLLALHVA